MESDVVTLQDVFVARPVDDRTAARSRRRPCGRSSARVCSRSSGTSWWPTASSCLTTSTSPSARCRPPAPTERLESRLEMRTALFDSDWGPIALGLAVGCIMLAAALVALARPRGAWLRSRLDPYGRLETTGVATTMLDSSPGWRPQAERLYGATERWLEGTRALASRDAAARTGRIADAAGRVPVRELRSCGVGSALRRRHPHRRRSCWAISAAPAASRSRGRG